MSGTATVVRVDDFTDESRWPRFAPAAVEHGVLSLLSYTLAPDLIGQAKGTLIERLGLDDTQAFDLLVTSSQDTNIKVIDVARWLVDETIRGVAHPTGSADGTTSGEG